MALHQLIFGIVALALGVAKWASLRGKAARGVVTYCQLAQLAPRRPVCALRHGAVCLCFGYLVTERMNPQTGCWPVSPPFRKGVIVIKSKD